MLRIGIYGICGKMGRRIADLALKDGEVEIVSAVEAENHPMIGKDMGEVLGACKRGIFVKSDNGALDGNPNCMVDFTLPDAVKGHLETCIKHRTGIVIGTTGLGENEEKLIAQASKKIPVVFSPNMSVGVNLLFKIVKESARVLGGDCDIKIDETHHVHKKDSPSGTAKMIAKVIKEASGKDAPIEAYRRGEIIGNHGIIFSNEFETLEIRHDARSRDVFVVGAIKAAKFLAGKKSGLYSMADVLGLK